MGPSINSRISSSPPRLQPRTAKIADLIADDIRRQMLSGDLRAGDNLPPEADLAVAYGVSRPTIREALRLLEADGLIRIRRGGRTGPRVSAPSTAAIAKPAGLLLQYFGATLGDVYRTRQLIEPPSAALLAARREEILDDLRAAEEAEAEQITDLHGFAIATAQFHDAVLRLSGSPTLFVIGTILSHVITLQNEAVNAARVDEAELAQREQAHRAHSRLVELVAEGNPTAAERHWRKHLDALARFVMTPGTEDQLVRIF